MLRIITTRCASVAAVRMPQRFFAAAAAAAPQVESSIFASPDLKSHSSADSGKIFRVTDEDAKQFYSNFYSPIDVKKNTAANEQAVLVRESAGVLRSCLAAAEEGKDAPRKILLHGRDGSGKSMLLAYLAHYCKQRNWVVALIPSALQWTHRSGDLDKPLFSKGLLDQNVDAFRFLGRFSALNAQIFAAQKVKGIYKFGLKQEATQANITLQQLANIGLSERRLASDIVGVLLKELKHSDLPLLVAIDGFNAFYEPVVPVLDFDINHVPASKLSLVHHVSKFLNEELPSAKTAVVATTSNGGGILPQGLNEETRKILKETKDIKASGSGDKRVKMQVPVYSRAEATAFAKYCNSIGWITKGLDERAVTNLQTISGFNPREVSRVFSSL